MTPISFQNRKITPFVYGIFLVLIIAFLLLSIYVVAEPPQSYFKGNSRESKHGA